MKPCIFVHQGYKHYLDNVFAITRKYNPDNRLILLGDDENKEVAKKYNIEFYQISEYNEEIPYYHFSTNGEVYEKFCFERWFIIKNFCIKHDILEILHSDSDNAFFVDLNTLNYTNARIGQKNQVVVPNVLFITTDYLLQICDYYLELFSLPEEKFIKEIKPFSELKQYLPKTNNEVSKLTEGLANKFKI